MYYTAHEANKLATEIVTKEREECKHKTEQWCQDVLLEEVKKAAAKGSFTVTVNKFPPEGTNKYQACRYMRTLGYSAGMYSYGYVIGW